MKEKLANKFMINRSILHMLLWFFGFSEGLFELFNIPVNICRFFVSLIIILLILSKKRKRVPPSLFILYSVFVLISISSIVGSGYFEIVPFFLFLLMALQGIIYFIVLINESHNVLSKIVSYANFWIIIQIPAIFLKYIFLGISEKGGIGTMSLSAGSLSAIFPAVAITLIVSQYFKTKNVKWIFWIGTLCLFGIIGEKRVLIILIPAIFLLMYLYNFLTTRKLLNFQFITMLIVAILFVYSAIRVFPLLNREKKVLGSFDLMYAIERINDYTTTDDYHYNQLKLRRKAGLVYFFRYLKNKDMLTYLFGEGPGKIVKTDFRKSSASMIDVYGVRYGGRMGIIWIYLQVGLLGAIVWLLLLFNIFYKIYKSKGTDIYTIAAILTFFIIIFDIGIYSYVSIRFFPVFSLWALFSSLSYRKNILGYNEVYNKKSQYFFISPPFQKSR